MKSYCRGWPGGGVGRCSLSGKNSSVPGPHDMGRTGPPAVHTLALQLIFHLIEQPMDAVWSRGPCPVLATWTMAS